MTSVPTAHNVSVETATISIQTLVIGKRQMTLTVLRQVPLIHPSELESMDNNDVEWRTWGQVGRFFADEVANHDATGRRCTEAEVARCFRHILILSADRVYRTYVCTYLQPGWSFSRYWTLQSGRFYLRLLSLAENAPQFYLAG